MSREILKDIEANLRNIVEHTAAANSAKATLSVDYKYPEVKNHVKPTKFLESLATEVLGEDNSCLMGEPTMGAEDFAFYLEKIPGSYFLLGVDDGRKGGYPSLHHPEFDFNDKALINGMRMFVHAALSWQDWVL